METLKSSALDRYVGDDYDRLNPGWHREDSPRKAVDILPALTAIVEHRGRKDVLNVADIGAGVGGVLMELEKQLKAKFPSLRVEGTAYEISPVAVDHGRKEYPSLQFHQKLLQASDGPHDVVMLIDVVEHVENPWELLRTCREVAEYLVLRQPLLDNFPRFRHDNYKAQRDTVGHITYLNIRSLLDLLRATGWRPLSTQLLASWELTGAGKVGMLRRMLTRVNRTMASFFIDGFYLNGAFVREK